MLFYFLATGITCFISGLVIGMWLKEADEEENF